MGLEAQNLRPSVRSGIGGQKIDQEPARIDCLPRGEGVSLDGGSNFGRGAEDDVGTKAAAALDSLLEPLGESLEIPLPGAEDDVTALQVSARVGESERFAELAERVHLDLVVAPQVDGAEQGNHHWHRRQYILLLWNPMPEIRGISPHNLLDLFQSGVINRNIHGS